MTGWQFPAMVMVIAVSAGLVAMAYGGHRGTGFGAGSLVIFLGVILGFVLPAIGSFADEGSLPSAAAIFGLFGGGAVGLAVGLIVSLGLLGSWGRAVSAPND
ncbi:hypothetical protein [Streptomyces lasiicapitis]|uniref:hypothetical protein n=1 Tax=Streptomyces lasiicapitis TaxID=1923961 RepID=UPI001662E7DE|nr:hypothetical protein [Streptomyces lasiicapitis]